MSRSPEEPRLAWIGDGLDFPETSLAWPEDSGAPGLLAAGSRLDPDILERAYSRGIFPWFSEGEPILWWSTDPRMVLQVAHFRWHRSLRQAIRKARSDGLLLRLDQDFESVMRACAAPRADQAGTWISEAMVQAYLGLHGRGLAHCMSLWREGALIGGLYCVSLGQMVYGESMFSREPNASKICLAALVKHLGHQGGVLIDCQQQTSHLASLGAAPIPRAEFEALLQRLVRGPGFCWDPAAVSWALFD